MPTHSLGRFLYIRVEALRKAMGAAAFRRELLEREVNIRSIQSLEDGTWSSISHWNLYVLSLLAKEHGVETFVQVVESSFWKTFYESGPNLLLAGTHRDGHHFEGDFAAGQALSAAGVTVEFRNVPRSAREAAVRRQIRDNNTIILGSSKNNVATEEALRWLWGGVSPVRFLLPEVFCEGPTISESPNRTRILEVRGRREEEREASRRLGIVAVGRHSRGARSTVIIAGCSKEATYMMLDELKKPDLYRLFHGPLEQVALAPLLFVFDSSAKGSPWQLVGHERVARGRGRPRKDGAV